MDPDNHIELLEELVMCPVCFSEPRTFVLPCGHSLCNGCAEEIADGSHSLRCPLCNAQHNGLNGAIRGKTSIGIAEIGKIFLEDTPVVLFSSNSHGDIHVLPSFTLPTCSSCPDAAEVFCNTCDRYFCSKCEKRIHKTKKDKHSLSCVVPPPPCSAHSAEPAIALDFDNRKFLCRICFQEAIEAGLAPIPLRLAGSRAQGLLNTLEVKPTLQTFAQTEMLLEEVTQRNEAVVRSFSATQAQRIANFEAEMMACANELDRLDDEALEIFLAELDECDRLLDILENEEAETRRDLARRFDPKTPVSEALVVEAVKSTDMLEKHISAVDKLVSHLSVDPNSLFVKGELAMCLRQYPTPFQLVTPANVKIGAAVEIVPTAPEAPESLRKSVGHIIAVKSNAETSGRTVCTVRCASSHAEHEIDIDKQQILMFSPCSTPLPLLPFESLPQEAPTTSQDDAPASILSLASKHLTTLQHSQRASISKIFAPKIREPLTPKNVFIGLRVQLKRHPDGAPVASLDHSTPAWALGKDMVGIVTRFSDTSVSVSWTSGSSRTVTELPACEDGSVGIMIYQEKSTTQIGPDSFYPGEKVCRGPDWKYGDQDGGAGSVGTLLFRDHSKPGEWVFVRWDKTNMINRYCVGEQTHIVYTKPMKPIAESEYDLRANLMMNELRHIMDVCRNYERSIDEYSKMNTRLHKKAERAFRHFADIILDGLDIPEEFKEFPYSQPVTSENMQLNAKINLQTNSPFFEKFGQEIGVIYSVVSHTVRVIWPDGSLTTHDLRERLDLQYVTVATNPPICPYRGMALTSKFKTGELVRKGPGFPKALVPKCVYGIINGPLTASKHVPISWFTLKSQKKSSQVDLPLTSAGLPTLMRLEVVTEENFKDRQLVARGPSWEYDDQDGVPGGAAILTALDPTTPAHAWVEWRSPRAPTRNNRYPIGSEGKFTLVYLPTQ
eukprot:gnl/Chilomastix_cuspidata/1632.p1 GENE.gnl/Chilomastix_cuspidata/1632~~gnl/Chilomastix_cuspidata/1632.p1  ORF type:complete len:972 (+),score=178.98 gnl/Chilomastix_cuspidata/1632:70-2916(+)